MISKSFVANRSCISLKLCVPLALNDAYFPGLQRSPLTVFYLGCYRGLQVDLYLASERSTRGAGILAYGRTRSIAFHHNRDKILDIYIRELRIVNANGALCGDRNSTGRRDRKRGG
jgi:hypothetical protein